MGSTGSASRKMWMLVGLLAVGALVQACSDNKGPAGPTGSVGADGKFVPAGQAGDPVTGFISLNLEAGPGEDQFIVTVFVFSGNGRPAAGRQVFLHTTTGSLNPLRGVTDDNGRFDSVLTCDGGATVTAFSEGATATAAACGLVVGGAA